MKEIVLALGLTAVIAVLSLLFDGFKFTVFNWITTSMISFLFFRECKYLETRNVQ